MKGPWNSGASLIFGAYSSQVRPCWYCRIGGWPLPSHDGSCGQRSDEIVGKLTWTDENYSTHKPKVATLHLRRKSVQGVVELCHEPVDRRHPFALPRYS